MKKEKYNGSLEGLTKLEIDEKSIVYARPFRDIEEVKIQYCKLVKVSNNKPARKLSDIVTVPLPAENTKY